MPDTIVRQKLRIPDKKPLGGDHSKYPVLQRSTCSNPKMFCSSNLMKNMRSSWDPCGFSVYFCFTSWIPRIKKMDSSSSSPTSPMEVRAEPGMPPTRRATTWTWCRGAMSPAVALQVWLDLNFWIKL